MFSFLRTGTIDDNVTIVVRGSSERTESICVALLAAEISQANIHLIHEVPFSAALRKSYEIGLAERRKWTLVIDADVLARPGIIQDLYLRAEATPGSVFVVQTEMLDKFFGGIRVGGIKVYRTKLLKEAIEIVPAVNIRPEGYVIKQMHHNRNLYADISDLVCGMHDFEQYYADVFRTGFTYGVKHATLTELLLPYWRRIAKKDMDFKVLLAGYKIGSEHVGDLKLDKDEVVAEFEQYKKLTKLNEKPNLETASFNPAKISNLMKSFVSPPEYAAVKTAMDDMGRPVIPAGV